VAIEVINRQRLARLDCAAIAELASATLASVGRQMEFATIAFVRDREIRRLNRDFRGKDRATDVLSFPATNEGADEDGFLGDIVIATDTAIRQAEENGVSLEREVSELVIHGLLHLCGYDHEKDDGEMNRIELKLRRKLLNV
jgi:probable rRNA maturation factor